MDCIQDVSGGVQDFGFDVEAFLQGADEEGADGHRDGNLAWI